MKISQKLGTLFLLSFAFMVVLGVLYWLIQDRMDYAAAARADLSDYRMIARSVKYGLLLVLLTFGVFFIYEIMRQLRIHPMQYILVGAALSIFYLLLLSFAEIIGFELAYLLASIACIALISWYLPFVLSSRADVIAVSLLLVITYGVMYMLLSMSQFSLVIGAVLLFLALFAVMYLTRHIDWYAIPSSETVETASAKS